MSSAAPSTARTASLPPRGLLALGTAACTAVTTQLLPAGLLPQLGAALHVPQGRVGFLVSAYAAASLASAIPLTAGLRGLRRRPLLIGVLGGFALCNAVTAASSTYPLTFAARLLAGAMDGMLWALLVGAAARMVAAERRGRAIAIVLAGITAALLLGIPAATAVAAAVGWRASFAALAALAVVLTAWVRCTVPDLPGEVAGGRVPLRRVARLPGVRAVLAVTMLLLLGHQALYTYLAPLAARAGFGRTGLVLLVFGGATAAGIGIVGTLVDRHLRPALLGTLTVVARPPWSTPPGPATPTWPPPCRPPCITPASPPGRWPAAWSGRRRRRPAVDRPVPGRRRPGRRRRGAPPQHSPPPPQPLSRDAPGSSQARVRARPARWPPGRTLAARHR
jgi:predicted MFS family arabinose efflux permease